MAVRTEMIDLVEYVAQLVYDATHTYFDTQTDIQRRLDDHREDAFGLLLNRDATKKVFTVWPHQYHEFGYLASDAVLNSAQDQSGTAVTADSAIDYFKVRYAFTAAQDTYVYLYLFGSAFNPFFAAADLLDYHPELEHASQISQLRMGSYSVTYARPNGKSKSHLLRERGMWLNRKYSAEMTHLVVDPYDELVL